MKEYKYDHDKEGQKIREMLERDREIKRREREEEAKRQGIPIEHVGRKPWIDYSYEDLMPSDKRSKPGDNADVPNAMDDGVALILYVLVMAVGTIFEARILIWIVATILFIIHKNRRKRWDAKWDREHKNDKK